MKYDTLAEQIEALAKKATAGDWFPVAYDEAYCMIDSEDDEWPVAHTVEHRNAALIVALVNAVPDLVAALREAEDAELSAGAVHAMRLAAQRATGGNCTFVDDDALSVVTLLMKVVEMHGIELEPAVARARAALGDAQ